MRKVLKNLVAVLVGFCLIGVIEFGLWMFGYQALSNEDPFVGFSGSAPLLMPDDEQEGVYRLNPAKAEYFNEQSIDIPKRAGKLRFVSFGGSTTYGRPWYGETSFSRWFSDLLSFATDKPDRFEHLNAGGISYASYRVRRLLEELSSFSPDLYVVYSGHNEFLEARTFANLKEESEGFRELRRRFHQSRFYSLLYRGINTVRKQLSDPQKTDLAAEVSVKLENVGGPELYHRDEKFRAGVIRQFRYELESMADFSRKHNIPLILCTLPVNLSGVSPFKSEHRNNITSKEVVQWRKLFFAAGELLLENDPEGALQNVLLAEQIDDRFAMLHFVKGQILDTLGRKHEAFAAYDRAKEEDIIPLRAINAFNGIIREVAESHNVPLADVEKTFLRVAQNGIPGNDLFADHVHPTLQGQQLIAWVVMETAIKNGLVPVSFERWQETKKTARTLLRSRLDQVDPYYRALGIWGVARLYFWGGKYQEAHNLLLEAWQVLKDVPEVPRLLGVLETFRGNGQAALNYFEKAYELDPDSAVILSGMANAYSLSGDGQKALEVLGRLPEDRYEKPGVQEAMGRAYLQIGDKEKAIAAFQKARQIAPEVPRHSRELAKALYVVGDAEGAQRVYRDYLRLEREPDPEAALQLWLESQAGAGDTIELEIK